MRKTRIKKAKRRSSKRIVRIGRSITRAEAVDIAASEIWNKDILCQVAAEVNYSSCKAFLRDVEKRKRREETLKRAFKRAHKKWPLHI